MLFELILTSAGLVLLNFEYLTLGLAGSFSALVVLTLAGTEAVLGLSLAANASRSRSHLNLMTRSLKATSLGSIFNSYIGDSAQPSTISYMWNFGSLLAICLVTQIISGVILAIHYCPSIDLAFSSVEHIMRDVSGGWIIRYTHANVASLFFACVYAHIARGIYYASYKSPRIAPWSVGVVILVFMILTAFLGYCLVIGQMSLWGATVITSILSALPWVGGDLTELVWGGFSVSNATLNRFYALHFLFPFILAALAMVHIVTLHKHGSGNPLGVDGSHDRLPMTPYFLFKDAVTAIFFLVVLIALVSFVPNWLGHSDNYVEANALVTPSSIVPEWYLLPWYAVLRSVPNKLMGVLAMLIGLLILLVLPATDTNRTRGARFNPTLRIAFWFLISTVFFLLYVGACHVAAPWVITGQFLTVIYFGYFTVIVPLTGLCDSTFSGPDTYEA